MLSAEDKFLAKSFLGPWVCCAFWQIPGGEADTKTAPQFIGSCLEFILMGVLFCQFVNYYNWYPNDSRGLRIAVAILCLLSVLKSVESFATLWIFLIKHFGDIQYAIQSSVTGWWDTGNPLMVGAVNFYVQCYFCSRLWAISKRWYVVGPILVLYVFAQLAMILGVSERKAQTYYIQAQEKLLVTDWCKHFSRSYECRTDSSCSWGTSRVWIRLFPTFVAGDLILTVTTAYFLVKTKKRAISTQTTGLLHDLTHLTFQTAAPAVVCAMFNLIFSQMYRSSSKPLLAYVEIAFNQPLPKVYAVSMMYTLNVRRKIRSRNGMSGSRDETPGSSSNDTELSRIEGLTTKTTQHVDVTDMFARTHSIQDSKLKLSSPDHQSCSELAQ
ncbi:hypothetical protein C8R45DRAFT_1125358 [Mycena sanguinolenta]|nr:hypothetical protein C8R45DRAFT_1125358 [Mycena sanguinolenta]